MEVAALLIAGADEAQEHFRRLAAWFAGIGQDSPLFFPVTVSGYKGGDVGKVYRLAEITREYFCNVYTGNC